MIPNWIKKNADKYLDWSFYGRCIKRDGEIPWVFLEGREFKEASFEEIANFEYDCQRTAATLVNCDEEEYLLIFPTNKIKYLRSDLKQLMGFKNVEILKLGYFERRQYR